MIISNEVIAREIKKTNIFDLRRYNILKDRFGEDNINNFFISLFNVANNAEKERLLDLYYPAYLSLELKNFEITTDNCLLIVDKYGINNVNKYFKDLLYFTDDKDKIKTDYNFFYELIDEEQLENNDENVSYDDTYTSAESFKLYIKEIIQYPVLTADEEKKYFSLLADMKSIINILSFDENYNLILNDIGRFINSVNTYEEKKKIKKLANYLNDDDKKIINKYVELWENINGRKKKDIIIPDYILIKDKIGLDVGKDKYETTFFNNQLDSAITYCTTREYICNCNLRLVISMAKIFRNSNFDIDDRTSEGNIGLIKAIEKFDYTKGYKFSTYATWWIKQSITRAIADQAKAIRIPVHMVEIINKIATIQKQLLMEFGREPTDKEIAEKMNLSVEKVKEIRIFAIDTTSLDSPVGEEEDSCLKDFVPFEGDGPEQITFKNSLRKALYDSFECLSTREREVLEYRYALNGGKYMTLEEVGKIFGVTRERVRQIEAKALRKIRRPNRLKDLKEYIND